MKALLVIDLYDDDINLEELTANVDIEKVKDCGYDYEPYTKRVYCTLRPLPEKKEENLPDTSIPWTRAEIMAYTHGIAGGYNECLEKILGESK